MAVLTGEKGYMSQSFYDDVKASGVSHILVVSGMHLAIIAVGLERILRIIIKNKLLINAILLAFVFFMCVLCGMSMSVTRAAIVYVVRAVYSLLNRNKENLHCLAFASLTVIFVHPYAVYSLIFGLSYASTLGILVLPQLMAEKSAKLIGNNKALNGIANTLYVSLSAYLLTLPICIQKFGYVSLFSVIVNLLVSLPTTLMLGFCVLAVVFGFIPAVERLFFILSDMLADYFIKIVEFFAHIEFCTVDIRNPLLLTVLILIIYLVFYIIVFKPYKLLKRGGKIADR